MTSVASAKARIISLDQFRGYTVAGMLLVNFLGGYQAIPAVLKHHNTYCSYADTIMPQFFFAVGFAYRLTFLRRLEAHGAWTASLAVLRRCAGLILLGFVIYHIDGKVSSWDELRQLSWGELVARAFRRELFQTLVHIAVASLWVLPVIAAGTLPRLAFLVASAGLHLWLSARFYHDWAWSPPRVIDGGPLGFLTWTIPLLVGSMAYDAMAAADLRKLPVGKLVFWSASLMLAGYAMACGRGGWASPPFVAPPEGRPVDFWTMNQRGGSVSYLTFSSGFSLAVYAAFVLASDRGGFQSAIFRTYGQNALAAYILHPMVASAIKPYVPNDAPLWYVAAGFGLYFAICTLFIRYLEENKIFLRL
jgi:predicted acyltransferase